jgi:hypothetical protein
MTTEIDKLTKAASDADKSEDALRLSQAALNLAHVKSVIDGIKHR